MVALNLSSFRPLRSLLLTLMLGVLLLTLFVIPQSVYASIDSASLLRLHNETRQAAGLEALTLDTQLSGAAQNKALDMLEHDYFAHTSPTGKTPWSWIDASGYYYQYAGENLGIDFADSDALFAAWLDSPGHRANIVKPEYRHLGIGMATGEYEGRQTTVVVTTFGAPFDTNVAIPQVAGESTTAQSQSESVAQPPLRRPILHEPESGTTHFTHNPIVLRGEAEPDALVEIQVDGKKNLQTPTDAAGEFAAEIELVDGKHQISLVTIARDGRRSTAVLLPENWELDTELGKLIEQMAMRVSATVVSGHTFGVQLRMAFDTQDILPVLWLNDQRFGLTPSQSEAGLWEATLTAPEGSGDLSLFASLERQGGGVANSAVATVNVLESYASEMLGMTVTPDGSDVRAANLVLFGFLLALTLVATSLSLTRILRQFTIFPRTPVWGWLNYLWLAAVLSPFLFVTEAMASHLI